MVEAWPCRFDHIYGVYRTKARHYRRMDIVICPADEWAMALVGWIGSRQYLRFMRQHAKDLGMFLNSHRQVVLGGVLQLLLLG